MKIYNITVDSFLNLELKYIKLNKNSMDWSTDASLQDDDDDKSISSESSAGGNQMEANNDQHNSARDDSDIWNGCEIGMTLTTLPNAEQAQELLNYQKING